MRVLRYETDKGILYDFHTMKLILGVNKSKLYRELKKIDVSDMMKYRNQFLFSENTLFLLMEKRLIEELDKIESHEKWTFKRLEN